MRFKTVPAPPADLEDVRAVRDALPRVPRSESDCCARLARRVDWIDDREAGREWLLFLRAAGLATRTAGGDYVRAPPSDEPSGTDELASAVGDGLRDRVLAGREVLEALDAESRDAADVFDVVRDAIPAWERRRSDDWEAIWRERVAAVLEWWVLLGAARRTDSGYARDADR